MPAPPRCTSSPHHWCVGETSGAYDASFDPDDPGPAGGSPLPARAEALDELERVKRFGMFIAVAVGVNYLLRLHASQVDTSDAEELRNDGRFKADARAFGLALPFLLASGFVGTVNDALSTAIAAVVLAVSLAALLLIGVWRHRKRPT